MRAESRIQGKLRIQRKYITCNNLGGRGLGWNKLILEEMMLNVFSLHGLSMLLLLSHFSRVQLWATP